MRHFPYVVLSLNGSNVIHITVFSSGGISPVVGLLAVRVLLISFEVESTGRMF